MANSKKKTADEICSAVQKKHGIVGRHEEIQLLALLLKTGRNVLIEGPVGVGKTVLAQAVAHEMGKSVIRIDGDSRFTEQKLTGWFDPATAMKSGFTKKSFIKGPLVEAMESGTILFINELNRMPEAVQNVLLPAIDEGCVSIPHLGQVHAKEGFLLVATQNPREFVATSHLSEALMDRMEWLNLGYQSAEEEALIVKSQTGLTNETALNVIVALVRMTRANEKIKRGASVRAAIAMAKLVKELVGTAGNIEEILSAVKKAALIVLPTRIELIAQEEHGLQAQFQQVIGDLLEEVKKNSKL